MILERRTRGQPLLALALILAGWVGARAVAWERAFKGAAHGAEAAALNLFAADSRDVPRAASAALRHRRVAKGMPKAVTATPAPDWLAPLPAPAPLMEPLAPLARPLLSPVPLAPPLAPVAPVQPSQRMMTAAGHQSLWLAATALLPLPPLGITASPAAPASPPRRAARWSGDGWLLLRQNDNTIAPGPRVGTYGASQVGAVIRYRLDPADSRKTSLYVRATGALNKTREQEAGLGLSARPVAALPVVAMAEARIVRNGSGVAVRPAFAAVTELPPQKLPLHFVGEAYVQGGWIGGKQPTGFIDGLVRAERALAEPSQGFSLKAGAGAWAAKQRGASRVDVGPIASVTVRLPGTASARVEADWRLRVAGRSKPDSGPVLTLSAGF